MPETRLLLKLAGIAVRSRSTRDFYDQIAPFYDSVFTDHLLHIRALIDALTEVCPSGRQVKVLDVACGTGALSRRLVEAGFSVTGVDFSFQSLRLLSQTNRKIPVVQADSIRLPFASSAFDVVTCMGAWRHFPNAQGVLQEICRVLRPRGILCLGYFPPKLGGIFAVPRNRIGETIVRLYGWLIRLLKYDDRTDHELELETIRMVELKFAEYRLIQSSKTEYLILAESPHYSSI